MLLHSAAGAVANESARIRFSDVGWTDITATTELTCLILEGLGYEPEIYTLSVPATFASLKAGYIDIFLGLWMPSMVADIKKYQEEGSIEIIHTNLTGAKYTLAVPKYVADAGIMDFADLAGSKFHFRSRIYGIEPGNDGNRLIQTMMDNNAFGLAKWKLVESSEQDMLKHVRNSVKKKKWIVFLGWDPHPMNTKFQLSYLTGGDDFFGPNLGGANVHTTVRQGYLKERPNVGKLLMNLKFSLSMESEVMGLIIDAKLEPHLAARQWLDKNKDVLDQWLKGVKTINGQNGHEAVKKFLEQ